ncbi:hypothetical protein NKG94_13800 [Micromonospora sp. M12]
MRTDLHGPLSAYAARLHTTAGDRHHVASPLGVWLLLAVCAAAASDSDPAAEALATALGTDLASATEIARTLLDAPHPLVGAATALWHRPGQGDGGSGRWRPRCPPRPTPAYCPTRPGWTPGRARTPSA